MLKLVKLFSIVLLGALLLTLLVQLIQRGLDRRRRRKEVKRTEDLIVCHAAPLLESLGYVRKPVIDLKRCCVVDFQHSARGLNIEIALGKADCFVTVGQPDATGSIDHSDRNNSVPAKELRAFGMPDLIPSSSSGTISPESALIYTLNLLGKHLEFLLPSEEWQGDLTEQLAQYAKARGYSMTLDRRMDSDLDFLWSTLRDRTDKLMRSMRYELSEDTYRLPDYHPDHLFLRLLFLRGNQKVEIHQVDWRDAPYDLALAIDGKSIPANTEDLRMPNEKVDHILKLLRLHIGDQHR